MSAVDPSSLCQIEIHVSDLKRSEKFYADAFGWRTVPVEILNYSMIQVPDSCPYGIALVTGPKDSGYLTARKTPVLFFQTTDLQEIKSRVIESGGKLLGWERVIPGGGLAVMIEDPDGNCIGVYKKSDIGR